MKRKKNARSAKRTALIVLCVLLALILAVMVMGTVYLETLFGRLNRPGSSGEAMGPIDLSTRPTESLPEDYTGPIYDADDVTMPSGPADIFGSEHIVNILLVGDDGRPGDLYPRSDSMILCSFNKETKTLTLTSFMRDMYVTIPGYWDDKLNHSFHYGAYYGDGAFELLDATLAYNFGVQIDGNVSVSFTGFQDVIDMVGGVDIELTAAEASYINRYSNSSLSEGMNCLNGAQALTHARNRTIGDDFARTNRQRIVLNALLAKAKSLSLTELNSLLMKALPLVTTDLSNPEIMGYAWELFPLLTDVQVVTQQIPAEGTYQFGVVSGMSVILVDFEANRQLLKDAIGG